jgi:hypothetical protein
VKDESWLAKVRKPLEVTRLFQELVPERHLAPRCVMEDANHATFSPSSHLLRAKVIYPQTVKIEGWSEQD